MEFKEDLQLAIGLRYQALANKQIDVVNGYSTDGMISALKLKRLKDDKNLWPPYYVVPVVRKDALDANPKIADVLNRVSATARRSVDGRDELQGRRRQDGAARRRARLPEGQGHRPLIAAVPPRLAPIAVDRRGAARHRRRRRDRARRALRSRSTMRRARACAAARARRRARSRGSDRRSTASTARSAPTPASARRRRRTSPPTRRAPCARARSASARLIACATRARDARRAHCRHGGRRIRRLARACSTRWSRCSTRACIRACPRIGSIGAADLAPLVASGAAADRRRRSRDRRRASCRAPRRSRAPGSRR